jgi:hypothetical protein
MDSDLPALDVEIGKIVFRSWEHQWETEEKFASAVASAKRALPSDFTKPIYEILEGWEQCLKRSSLPFAPYNLRIRPTNDAWKAFTGGFDPSEILMLHRSLREMCAGWDGMLPQPRTKQGKYGQQLVAPAGDQMLLGHYEVEWHSVTVPDAVNLDTLLRTFSPRYKRPRYCI